MKRLLIPVLAILASCETVTANGKVLTEFTWNALHDAGKLQGGTIVTLPDQSSALKVENSEAKEMQRTLFTVESPKIGTDQYAISGEVRYENVEGDGYLEMWSYFGETESYFSRTLGQGGPMGKLSGTSDWRAFTLPFDATGAKAPLTKLVVNLHLRGKGTVYLRGTKLSQLGMNRAWWTERSAGLIGGIGGALLGCLGSLMEWLAVRGRSRSLVVATMRALIAIGVVGVVSGCVAVAFRQPYAVWFSLLLLGVLCVLVFPYRLRRYEQKYRDLELRRMTSMDAA